MITSWQLYWLIRLDYIQGLMILIAIPSFIAILFMLIIFPLTIGDVSAEDEFEHKKLFIIAATILASSSLAFCVIPSTKEMAAILILPKIINNEKVRELPDNFLNLANEWIKELSPTERKEK